MIGRTADFGAAGIGSILGGGEKMHFYRILGKVIEAERKDGRREKKQEKRQIRVKKEEKRIRIIEEKYGEKHTK